jgi:hypothetical protein
VRLDHLLSKEHHEKGSGTGSDLSREGVVRCSGGDRVQQQQESFSKDGKAAGTLLGPETTPGPVSGLCCRPVLVVGCGVW